MTYLLYFNLLLLSLSALAADYTEAFNKTQEAAYIQTGLKSNVDRATQYFETKTKTIMNSLHLDTPTAVVYYGYITYKHKELKIPIKPITISATPDSVSGSITMDITRYF